MGPVSGRIIPLEAALGRDDVGSGCTAPWIVRDGPDTVADGRQLHLIASSTDALRPAYEEWVERGGPPPAIVVEMSPPPGNRGAMGASPEDLVAWATQVIEIARRRRPPGGLFRLFLDVPPAYGVALGRRLRELGSVRIVELVSDGARRRLYETFEYTPSRPDRRIEMTNPRGRCFISYPSPRQDDVRTLVAALEERGVPTWIDLEDLGPGSVERELRDRIRSPDTACSILWITPEVAASPPILRAEAPEILQRAQDPDDPFFVVPVAAGGLDIAGAAEILESVPVPVEPRSLRFEQVSGTFTRAQAASIASKVLRARLQRIDDALAHGEPLRLGLFTRQDPTTDDADLVLDWTYHFRVDGQPGREASPESWSRHLLPALRTVAAEVKRFTPRRTVMAHGYAALGASLALGTAFSARGGIRALHWLQQLPGGVREVWSLTEAREDCGFRVRDRGGEMDGRHLALLISTQHNVGPAFQRSRAALSLSLRRWEHMTRPGGQTKLLTAGEATDLAYLSLERLNAMRAEYPPPEDTVHLFLEVPAGVATMIGQLLNTYARVQTYEFVSDGGEATYRPAALLEPNR